MSFQIFLLLFLSLSPVIIIVILILLPKNITKNTILTISLNFSVILFLSSLVLWIFFDKLISNFQYIYTINIFNSFEFIIGIDGLSIFFVILTTFIFPLCLISQWFFLQNFSKKFVKYNILLLLFLEFLILNAFIVLDLLLFFILFESILLPMFLLIGTFGSGQRKIKASFFLFFYTMFGSIFLFIMILIIFFKIGSLNFFLIFHLFFFNNNIILQYFLWFCLFISCLVKIPTVPLHIWLPEAHVEAPTFGSVILAALLLKLGGYALIRFLPIVPQGYIYFSPLVFCLAIISILYSSMITIRQIDLKKIIAYSSIAHMNLVLYGIFTLKFESLQGSIFLMLSHGIISAGLFFIIGFLYDRYHTKFLKYYGGLVIKMPIFAIIFLFFSMANLAFPGTTNFIGELLIFLGAFERNFSISFIAGFGIIFSAFYSLWFYNRLVFSSIKLIYIPSFLDFNKREFFIILPLIILAVFFGIFPNIILDHIYISLKLVINFINYSI